MCRLKKKRVDPNPDIRFFFFHLFILTSRLINLTEVCVYNLNMIERVLFLFGSAAPY